MPLDINYIETNRRVIEEHEAREEKSAADNAAWAKGGVGPGHQPDFSREFHEAWRIGTAMSLLIGTQERIAEAVDEESLLRLSEEDRKTLLGAAEALNPFIGVLKARKKVHDDVINNWRKK